MISRASVLIRAFLSLSLAFAPLQSVLAASTPSVSAGSLSSPAGSTVTLPINLTTAGASIASLQFTMTLPSGWSFGSVAAGNSSNGAGKSVSINPANGTIIVFGLNQTAILDGDIADVQINIPANATSGANTVGVGSLVLSSANGSMIAGSVSNGSVQVQSQTINQPVSGESIFTNQVPATLHASDGAGTNWELGVVFQTTVSGQIAGLRFYKDASESGLHIGHLWDMAGNLLATVTFTNETASGWQVQALQTPVSISANTSYVASVDEGNSYRVHSVGGLATQISNGHLISTVGNNGLAGAPGSFPNSTYQHTNYFRDVVFQPASVPAPTIASFTASPTSIAVGRSSTLSWSVSNATSLSISGVGTVSGTSVSVSPTQTTTYVLTATNSAGSTTKTVTVSVTAAATPGVVSAGSATANPGVTIFLPVNFTTGSTAVSGIQFSLTLPSGWSFGTATAGAAAQLAGKSLTLNQSNGTIVIFGLNQTAIQNGDVADIQINVPASATTGTNTMGLGSLVLTDANGATLPGSTNNGSVQVQPQVQTLTGESIFTSQLPQVTNASDGPGTNWELGTIFKATVSGQIVGLRFFKDALESGVHVGHLWDTNGNILATVTFSNETSSGWQVQALQSPVTIAANTSYITSVDEGNSYRVHTVGGLASVISNGHLISIVGNNGVAGASGSFPTSAYQHTNYFRDVVFQPSTVPAPTIASFSASPATINKGDSTTLSWSTNNATSLSISGVGTVSGTSLSVSPTQTTTYTLSATNATGSVSATTQVTVNVAQTLTGESIFTTQVPQVLHANDGAGTNWELGVVFQTTVDGLLAGLRFYKDSSESGTHMGHLWDTNGTLLATTTFTNETASGWQIQALSSPVSIKANTSYVASVDEGNSYRVHTVGGLASMISNGHLVTMVGNNGLAGTPGSFPTTTYQHTNYFRDVVFQPGSTTTPPPPPPPSSTPAPTIGSFTASPAAITAGASTTLAWTTTDATGLSISGVGTVSGTSFSVSPTQTTTYTLLAANSSGSVSKTVTVTVTAAVPAPTITSFTASPATLTAGGSSTLSWATSNATSLSINGTTVTGSSKLVTLTQTTSYTLTATNSAGSVSQSVTIAVNAAVPAPTIGSFLASPTSIVKGASSTLSWNVSGATSISISSLGAVTGTTVSVMPTQTTTYTLTATNATGSATATAKVTVTTPAPPAGLSISGASISGTANGSVTMPVTFTAGSTGISSIQFNAGLPSGWSIASVATGAAAQAASKTATVNTANGTVIIFGLNQTSIGTGVVANLVMNIPASATLGANLVTFSGLVLSDANGANVVGSINNGTVTVGSLPSPIITSSVQLPVSGTLEAQYPSGYQVHRFKWQISFSQNANVAGAAGLLQSTDHVAASMQDASNQAPLGQFSLAPGLYQVSVSVELSDGRVSPAASANVMLVQAADLNDVRIYPNPWRADRHAGKDIVIDNAVAGSGIKLFTISGHQVRTLTADGSGAAHWNRTNDDNDEVGSGIYFYVVTDPAGRHTKGKLAIIR